MHAHIGCPGYNISLLRYLHPGGMHLEWRYSSFSSYRPSRGKQRQTELAYGLGPRLVLLCVASIAMHAYCHKLKWMHSK
jgi:hypothetical protein